MRRRSVLAWLASVGGALCASSLPRPALAARRLPPPVPVPRLGFDTKMVNRLKLYRRDGSEVEFVKGEQIVWTNAGGLLGTRIVATVLGISVQGGEPVCMGIDVEPNERLRALAKECRAYMEESHASIWAACPWMSGSLRVTRTGLAGDGGLWVVSGEALLWAVAAGNLEPLDGPRA